MKEKKRRVSNKNPVKRSMDRFTRPATHKSKKDKQRRIKHKGKVLDDN